MEMKLWRREEDLQSVGERREGKRKTTRITLRYVYGPMTEGEYIHYVSPRWAEEKRK